MAVGKHKWLCYFAVAMITVFTALTLATIFLEQILAFTPPSVSQVEISQAATTRLNRLPDHVGFGRCWRKQERGLTFLYIEGPPFFRGWAAGKLVGAIAPQMEDALLQRVRQYLSPWQFWALRKLGYAVHYDLPRYFPATVQQEVYGYANAVQDRHPELGPIYSRLMHYQAAHDIAHQVMDRVLSLQGCTAFAAWGKATADGHLLIGRNFDFEIGQIFDKFKVVHIVVPNQGIPFVSISWPGMSGVVSGINRTRIAVTINAGKSDHRRDKGTPVTIVARKILQQASSLEQAIAIATAARCYISESFLIADGKIGQAVVIEKSPQIAVVRRAGYFRHALACSNHFLSPLFQAQQKNWHWPEKASSMQRLRRLRELITRHDGKITPTVAAAILRDYRRPGGSDIGLGHEYTINPGLCSHSLIIDVTAGIVWISRGPHQSGPYLPIAIAKVFGGDPKQDCIEKKRIIAADQELGPDKIEKLQRWRQAVEQWQRLQSVGEQQAALVQQMVALNPRHFLTMVACGDLHFSRRQVASACRCWRQAIADQPYDGWPQRIQRRLRSAAKIARYFKDSGKISDD